MRKCSTRCACSSSSAGRMCRSLREPCFPWCARSRELAWRRPCSARWRGSAHGARVHRPRAPGVETADFKRSHDPYFVPPLPEGAPHTLPLDQDAAHFLIAQVHAHPHQVTICALGPLTNIALALAIDPHFAELTQGIVLMGGSLDPQTADPEFCATRAMNLISGSILKRRTSCCGPIGRAST